MRTQTTILSNLILNEDFTRKVLPYIKSEYFDNPAETLIFDKIKGHVDKYNRIPTTQILTVEMEEGVIEETHKEARTILNLISREAPQDLEWMTNTTEKWCRDRAIYNALNDSLAIWKSDKEKGSIPRILEDAIAVSFDSNVGHDYLEDSTQRYDYYHRVEKRIPFDLEILNEVTKGGVPDKSLSVILGGVHVGKTLCMCSLAASNLIKGKNVLYISMEMSEEMIAERIDANLLDISIETLRMVEKNIYDKRINMLKETLPGKLIIKEFPTAAANVNDFRHLLNELRLKRKFKPDIVYIDYLNICSSSRLRVSAGLYLYVKSIAEEIRGLAIEQNLPIFTASQLNRTGFESDDPGMIHASESFGLPAIADLLAVIYIPEELKAMGNVMQVKQLKNRFSNMMKQEKFLLGVDYQKMKLSDIPQ